MHFDQDLEYNMAILVGNWNAATDDIYGGTNILPSADNHNNGTYWPGGSTFFALTQPDYLGGTTGERLREDTGSGSKSTTQYGISTTAGTHRTDLWVKALAGSAAREVELDYSDGAWTNGIYFNMDEAGNYATGTWGSGWAVLSSNVYSYGTGWYHYWFTFTIPSGASPILSWIGLINGGTSSYTGDGASGFYVDNHRLYKL